MTIYYSYWKTVQMGGGICLSLPCSIFSPRGSNKGGKRENGPCSNGCSCFQRLVPSEWQCTCHSGGAFGVFHCLHCPLTLAAISGSKHHRDSSYWRYLIFISSNPTAMSYRVLSSPKATLLSDSGCSHWSPFSLLCVQGPHCDISQRELSSFLSPEFHLSKWVTWPCQSSIGWGCLVLPPGAHSRPVSQYMDHTRIHRCKQKK